MRMSNRQKKIGCHQTRLGNNGPSKFVPPIQQILHILLCRSYKTVTFISQLFPIIAWLPADIGKANKTYIIFATTEINARYYIVPHGNLN